MSMYLKKNYYLEGLPSRMQQFSTEIFAGSEIKKY